MSEAPRELRRLQSWLQTVVMHPGGVQAGLSSADARHHIEVDPQDAAQVEQIILPSKALPSLERLAIYSQAYHARLMECLHLEFPVLYHALGEELFGLFSTDYLQHYPSHSYTLARLGERFPHYLSDTRPHADAQQESPEDWPDFIIDLAILERAFGEVYDGPGVEGQQLVSAEQLSGLSESQLYETCFVPVVCLRVFAFHYPVSQYFCAVRSGQDPPLPPPAETYTAMLRRDYVVHLYELSAHDYMLLHALMDGSSLSRALRHTTEKANCPPKVLTVLSDWADKGFFASLVPCHQ